MAPPILLALTFHEYSHAYVANRLGDSTAKDSGRLTLNPLSHLDLLGTIMVFIIHIGWAKPVTVNPANFKNPRKDLLWVSLAGPASNLLLAIIFGLLYRFMQIEAIYNAASGVWVIGMNMISFAVLINLILAFFNLIPLPPLDGSKILSGLVPAKYDRFLSTFERYGHFALLALVVLSMVFDLPVFSYFYMPFVRLLSFLFAGESLI
ncbi:site-2 protease family protein [candidate division KSB1 bacterium]|nr:site-2 protease family protein [candidate division KSB1 bacterium]